MKKILGFVSLMLCLATCIVSCMKDAEAKATCTYAVLTDSIVYSDSLDAQYDSLIRVSLKTLGHSNYTFTESAEVDESSPAYAVAVCNDLAADQFTQNLKKEATLSAVQNEMFKANSDYFTAKGIPNAAAIGLHPFVAYLALWNSTNAVRMGYGEFHVSH